MKTSLILILTSLLSFSACPVLELTFLLTFSSFNAVCCYAGNKRYYNFHIYVIFIYLIVCFCGLRN